MLSKLLKFEQLISGKARNKAQYVKPLLMVDLSPLKQNKGYRGL
jgi:hypothetical protein